MIHGMGTRAFLSALVLLIIVSSEQLAQVSGPPSSGLVAHWSFEDGSGAVALDSSGNGNNITLHNGPAWTTGKQGGGLAFDGLDDSAETNSDSLAPESISVSLWLKANGAPSYLDGLAGRTRNQNWNDGYGFYFGNASQIRFFINNWAANVASAPLDSMAWNHIVGTYDGSTVRIYVNGVPGESDSFAGTRFNGGSFRLGSLPGGHQIHATVDEVRVYNRALTTPEVLAIYASENGSTPPPPPVDDKGPVISGVSASNVTPTSAVISWTTDEPADSQVEFVGSCPAAGCFTPATSSLVTAHSVSVSNLTPSTTYAVKARSKDAAGNLTVSGQEAFATPGTPPPPPPPPPPDGGSGLVAHWTFDEGTGTTADDATGDGNPALLRNGATWGTGKVGPFALALDGANDFASVDTVSLDDAGALTIALWVKADSLVNYDAVFAQTSNGNWNDGYGIYFASGNAHFFVNHWNSSKASGPISAGVWRHIAGTFDGSQIKIYIDGVLRQTTPASGPLKQSSVSPRIGAAPGGSSWHGLIDDIRFYDRALPATEIAHLAGPTDVAPPTISDVSSRSIRSTSAVISWTTNEPADSQVEYGTTLAYGNTTSLNPQLFTAHSQALVNLNPSTTYHYRVRSKDAAANSQTSGDFTFTTAGAFSQKPPNIIFILADDLGWQGVGAYGQALIQTPNIDQLAQEGMLFTDAYAGSSVCCPARSTFLTGQHSGHTRLRHNESIHPETGEVSSPSVGALVPRDVTVAEVLKQAGYATGLVGKWHTGGAETSGFPTLQGFDYFLGHLTQSDGAVKYYGRELWENTTTITIPENFSGNNVYVEDLYTQKAIDFINANRDNPFFLKLAYNVPHLPLAVPSLGPYAAKPWTLNQKFFAAMVTHMDTNIGSIMATLADLGLDEQTLVIFTSDNGPEFCCPPAEEAEARFDNNGPLRDYKKTLYEGGIRVPFIARWPGSIPANIQNQKMIASYDLLPTFAELANTPPSRGIDGISIVGELLGVGGLAREYLYWEIPGRSQALRMGDWKGVRHFTPAYKFELFNLAQDIGEQNDLASSHPALVQQMEGIMNTGRTVGAHDGFPTEQIDSALPCREIEYLNGVDLLSYSGGSPACAELARAEAGQSIYTDASVTLNSLPAKYNANVLLRHANADKSFPWSTFMRVAVRQPSTVVVAYQANASTLPAWLGGWTPTGESITAGGIGFDVYSKAVPKNATVFLGGNAQGGANAANSYFVLINTGSPTAHPTHLVADWRFNETSGVVLKDGSGYGYDGLLYNGSHYSGLAKIGNGPTWVAGRSGNALRFDGVDDSVWVDTGTTWQGDFTAAAWAKTSNKRQNGIVLTNLQNFWYGPRANAFEIGVNFATGDYHFLVISSSFSIAPVDTTNWQFLAVTLSGTTLKTYSNGVHTNTYTLGPGQSNFFRDYMIGANTAGNRYFDGLIDDVRVYKRALTDSEIGSLFNGGL